MSAHSMMRPRGSRVAQPTDPSVPWAESAPGAAEPAAEDVAQVQGPRLAWKSPQEYYRLVMGRSPIIFILGALLIVEETAPVIPAGVPISETVMGLLILGALLRSGRLKPTRMPVVGVLLVAAFFWLLAVSMAQDVEWTRRMVRIAMLFSFAMILATGRVPLRPLVLGMWAGLLVNTVLFYLGIAPDYYGGVLSGYLLDKNVAGFYYAVVPLLVYPFVKNRWWRAILLILGLYLVFLTGSRTGLAAMILGVGWMALGGRGGPLIRASILAAFYFVFIWAEENLATLSVFGDRTGTDWFRARIDAESEIKMRGALPWGDGAGEAFILLPPEQVPFFFHNSYWSLLVEGGIPLLVAIVSVFAIGGFGIGSDLRSTSATRAAQASVIVILLVSFRLGEVFMTVPAMVALGGAMALWEMERRRTRQELRVRRQAESIESEPGLPVMRGTSNR